MLEIPEILEGKEVKKFEDLIRDLRNTTDYSWGLYINAIDNLYTQPFTPDLIEKYFNKMPFKWYSYYEEENSAWFKRSEGDNGGEPYFEPAPKTLSDFIDVMLNLGLKLTWR
jgi:hypothetical protein